MDSRTGGQLNQMISKESEQEYICRLLEEVERLKQICEDQKNKLEQYRQKLSQTQDMVSVLQVRAEQDSLTGLYNASTTKQLAREFLETAEPDRDSALLIIDLDNFKQVNDNYGHMVGDKVLIGAAAKIKKLFRSHDIVGRVGGDEFLVLMKDVPDSEIVKKRCNQLIEAFGEINDEQLGKGMLGCSIGVAQTSVCGTSYDRLFCCADSSLYRSKAVGGKCFSLYREGDPEQIN